jgi:hypothetical protein
MNPWVRSAKMDPLGSFRQDAALSLAIKRHLSGGDCFVALRAPRNDGIWRLMTTYPPSLRAKRSNLASVSVADF